MLWKYIFGKPFYQNIFQYIIHKHLSNVFLLQMFAKHSSEVFSKHWDILKTNVKHLTNISVEWLECVC